MFAGERAAMLHNEISRLIQKRAELRDSRRAVEVERNPAMNATLTKMAVERRGVLIPIEQVLELTEIGADPLRRHGRVLPTFPRVGVAGNPRRRAQAAFAHFPDQILLF